MIGHGSPESSQHHNVKNKVNKTYLANPKIHKNKIRPAGVKFSGKAANDGAVRASSGSNRHQYVKGEGHIGSTYSKPVVDTTKYQKSPMMLDSVNSNKHGDNAVQTSMPIVVKTRNSNNIYGTVKNNR